REFMTDVDIKQYIKKLVGMYSPLKRRFILKICGKMATDLKTLNRKILVAYGELKDKQPIFVQLSIERLILLSRLDDTAFLKPRIFPSLKYFLKKGDEEQCLNEIKHLFHSLRELIGIKVIVSISIENP